MGKQLPLDARIAAALATDDTPHEALMALWREAWDSMQAAKETKHDHAF